MEPIVKSHVQFQDFDALKEAIRDWDLDLVQLGRGLFQADVLQTFMDDLLVTRAAFLKKVEQTGASPKGYRTFVFLVNPDAELNWRGHEVTGNDIMLFPESGELYSISDSLFHVVTCSIRLDRIESYFSDDRFADMEKVLKSSELFRCTTEQMTKLRKLFSRFFELTIRDAVLLEVLKGELIEGVLEACHSSAKQEYLQVESQRSATVRRAKEAILEAGISTLRVSDLAQMAQVSARTLEYAFRDHFQMSPKAYMQSYRLHQVRMALKQAESHQNIKSVAEQWGFWHAGQFAADYRKMFGELPRQTFKRVRN